MLPHIEANFQYNGVTKWVSMLNNNPAILASATKAMALNNKATDFLNNGSLALKTLAEAKVTPLIHAPKGVKFAPICGNTYLKTP